MMYRKKRAFTLIELIVSLGILTILIPVVFGFVIGLQNKSYLVKIKSQTIANLSVLNSEIQGIIKNSYGISYSDSNENMLTVFTDKLEKNKLSIFLKKTTSEDISRVYISINNNEGTPLHGTQLYINSLVFDYKKNESGTQDVQPWASFIINGRSRSPLEAPTDDAYYNLYNTTNAKIYGRVLIRNYVPSSQK